MMTRVNVVPVSELCDQHLHGEWHEITRIPNGMLQGKYLDKKRIPARYTVRTNANPNGGVGHMYFFTDKLAFLEKRYKEILQEAEKRGMSLSDFWPDVTILGADRYNEYVPDAEALALNRKRIAEMMPMSPRYYKKPMLKAA